MCIVTRCPLVDAYFPSPCSLPLHVQSNRIDVQHWPRGQDIAHFGLVTINMTGPRSSNVPVVLVVLTGTAVVVHSERSLTFIV